MELSLTPLLVAVELGFILFIARHAARVASAPSMRPVYLHIGWLSLYALGTSYLGLCGVYVSPEMLALYPALWLQVVTVCAAVLPVLVFPGLRQALRAIVDHTPWHWFAGFHAMRVAALGTAYKTMIGEFPAYFEYFVGVPDLLFGLSAFWMIARIKDGRMSLGGFLTWNLIGALVIVPSAPVLLQLGLPGPMQVFTDLPDARAVFTYPMSIAPMIGVPLFVLVNLWVAWRLWERGLNETARQT